MKRGIFLLILTSLMYASFSQNLVVNQGLEAWSKSNKPAGWNIATNCLKDSSSVNSGLYSCRHYALVSETKNLGQTISVVGGKDYSFSFMFKTEVTGTEHGCRIWCSWKDATSADITDAVAKLILQPSTYMKSDVWQRFTVDITAPENAKYFYLEVRTYQNTIAYYDDFAFEESIPTNNSKEHLSEIKIYPNPAGEYLNISNLQGVQYIDIQSLTGVVRWTSDYKGEENVLIPLSGFPTGLYIVQIRTTSATLTKKIIIK